MEYFIVILLVCGQPLGYIAHDGEDIYRVGASQDIDNEMDAKLIEIFEGAEEEGRVFVETASKYGCT